MLCQYRCSMPQMYETHFKWVLITCAGFLAGSLGVFASVLSIIISPLLSLFATPKLLLIGQDKTAATTRFQLPPEKIYPRYAHRPSSDKSSSRSSTTLSSNSTATSTHSNPIAGNKTRRSSSPNGTRFREDIFNAPDTSVPAQMPMAPSPPKPPRSNLRTRLGVRKRSTTLDEPTPEETGPTLGAEFDPDKRGHEQNSHEQKLDQAEIIVSPPTPSSSVFLLSAPGPSEVRSGDSSTAGKPAARFVKSHSKRHSLTAVCPRKRRSGKRSPTSPTSKSASPATSPAVESKWRIGTRASQCKKRKSLRIDPPLQSSTSSVLLESGADVGGEIIYEEPIDIIRPHISHLPLTPARQGPVRTRPYEAPYFFPTPGSPEAIGYVERVREERRSTFSQPDPTPSRNKKGLKKSPTMSNLGKDSAADSPKLGAESGYDQVMADTGRKRSKSTGRGPGSKDSAPSSAPANELGVQFRTRTIPRKSSAPAQLSPSLNAGPTPPTSPRSQTQRQGTLGIMRILGKH